jgi:hypothetical protein
VNIADALDSAPNPTFADIHKQHDGTWAEVLPLFGIDAAILDGAHHPCPGCGGKDRFRFDDKDGRGTWMCSQGGGSTIAGDGAELLIHAKVARDSTDALKILSGALTPATPQTRSVTRKTPYKYLHADGELALTVTRVDQSNGDKTFSQRTARGLAPTKDDQFEHLPYNLPALVNKPDAPIHIVEGEKCADALNALGLVATCNAGGAGNWRPELAQYFAGRDVVILPDNDEAGEAHSRKVADALFDIAKAVSVCRLPGLEPKGDVVDWLAMGNTSKDLWVELQSAKLVDDGLGMTLAELLAADFTVPEPVHKHIPAGLTLFAGAPKAGKSTFMEWLAYEVALHDPVIYLALEYSPPMAQQRFRWMADSRLKMRLFTQAQAPRMGEGGDAWLDRLLTKIRPRLVVIDTLARFKRQADQKGYEAETDAMAEMAALFNKHETSAVIIHHTRKGGQNDDPDNPFEKMLGSTALAAVPDNLIVLEGADGKTVLHTRGRMISQRKDVFELRGHRFELNTEPGAILAGKADVQASILNFLADGPATQKEIVEALGLRQGHVSNYIKKLSAARLLKRGPPVELIDQGAGLF